MERTIVKLDSKDIPKKLERWQKIAKEASTQSGRQRIPTILEPIKFQNIIENIGKYDIVLLPFENEKNYSLKEALKRFNCDKDRKSIAIIIGPEGGFSDIEVDMLKNLPNVEVVTLGGRVLRTETAGPATIAMISYEFEMQY